VDLGRVTDVRHFRAGDRIVVGAATVHTIPTPHDAADPVAFVVECEGKRLAVLTDLGHPFEQLSAVLAEVDAAYLESNYDPQMLATGSYPLYLKARIRGRGGHISNDEAAELLARLGRRRPRWVALAHLSEQNNEPELALNTHRSRVGRGYPFSIAGRYGVSDVRQV
jgi:phosphoribosyl 1,2-cyclic phosphodiesterase